MSNRIYKKMPNVNHQRASRPAATLSRAHIAIFGRYLRALSSVEQPPRLRAQDTFAFSVDSTSLKMIPTVYPPPSYTAVNPCRSRQEGELGWGNRCPDSGTNHSCSDCHDDKQARAFPAQHTVRARTECLLDSPKGFFALHYPLLSMACHTK